MLRKLPEISQELKAKNLKLTIFFFLLLAISFQLLAIPVFAQENKPSFIKVKDLQVGDTVFPLEQQSTINNQPSPRLRPASQQSTSFLKPDKIVEKKRVEEAVKVYNLTVDGDQTYFANDLAVHNKAEALRAYFFWDIDGDGCHDDTTAIITHPLYKTYCDNVNTRNPGAELVEPVIVHGVASVLEDPNLPDMREGDAYANWDSGYGPYRAFNDSIGDTNEMYTVHGKIALGAMMDGGGGEAWTFGQTNRGAEFRVGGWNFSDYQSGADRRVHCYAKNDWVGGDWTWRRRIIPVDRRNLDEGFCPWYPTLGTSGGIWLDFKAEKDYTGYRSPGVPPLGGHLLGGISEEDIWGPGWGDAFQIAEFTADYSGMYYMEHLYCSNDAFNNAGSLLFAKDNPADVVYLPDIIAEREDMCAAWGVSHCAIDDPQTYGFTGSLVGGFGCGSKRGRYWLTEGASYVLLTHVDDLGYHVSSGFPFWQYDKSRLRSTAPYREVKQAVAAIPLIKPGATIDGRIWEEPSLTDCAYDGSESGVSVDISLTKDGAEEASSSYVDSYLYAVSEPGDYTVTINNIPGTYTMSDDCKGSLFTCNQANQKCWNSFPLTISQDDIDTGLTFEINFPLVDMSVFMGTLEVNVWDESSTIDACGSYDVGESLSLVNISIIDSSGGTVYSGPSSGYLPQLVDPAKTYTVTAVLPTNYMHSGCGFIQTGNDWSRSGITVAVGTTTSVDLPLLPYGSISGTVYEVEAVGDCSTSTQISTSDWAITCNTITARQDGADPKYQFTCLNNKVPQTDKLELGGYGLAVSGYPMGWSGSACWPDGSSFNLTPGSFTATARAVLSKTQNAWFQVTDGDIHANNGGIQSLIPDTCSSDPVCQEYLFLSGAGGYPGVASTTTGTISLDAGSLSDNSSYEWRAESGSYDGEGDNYAYYSFYLEEGATVWGGSPPTQGVWKTTASPFTIGGGADWENISDQVVILHNGATLNISGDITVASGGSLVVISSGTINISSSVENLHGIYIADTINTGSGYEQLTVEGSLIGEGSVNLERDLDSGDASIAPYNYNEPAETVVYRPDIVVNAHEALKRPQYTWQEIAP